jgi:hypothetical protein
VRLEGGHRDVCWKIIEDHCRYELGRDDQSSIARRIPQSSDEVGGALTTSQFARELGVRNLGLKLKALPHMFRIRGRQGDDDRVEHAIVHGKKGCNGMIGIGLPCRGNAAQ